MYWISGYISFVHLCIIPLVCNLNDCRLCFLLNSIRVCFLSLEPVYEYFKNITCINRWYFKLVVYSLGNWEVKYCYMIAYFSACLRRSLVTQYRPRARRVLVWVTVSQPPTSCFRVSKKLFTCHGVYINV